jgi:hypothetical protein
MSDVKLNEFLEPVPLDGGGNTVAVLELVEDFLAKRVQDMIAKALGNSIPQVTHVIEYSHIYFYHYDLIDRNGSKLQRSSAHSIAGMSSHLFTVVFLVADSGWCFLCGRLIIQVIPN